MFYQNKWRQDNWYFYNWWFEKKGIKWSYCKRTCYLKENWRGKACYRRSRRCRKKSCRSSRGRWSRKRKACWSKKKSRCKTRSSCRKARILARWKPRTIKRWRIRGIKRRRKNIVRIFGLGHIWSQCYCWWVWGSWDNPYFCSF